MFSTITSVPSIRMPKSMAPMESRLAGIPSRVQKDEREQQRQRNGERHNDGRAHAHQERHQHHQHQHHAQQQVVLHGVDGQLHQVAAVVVGTHLHVGRQDVFVQLLGLGLDALEDVLRLLAAAHHDDAFDRVIGLVEAELAQARARCRSTTWPMSPMRVGHAVLRADENVGDIGGIADQADAAHVIELLALRIESAAGVGVVHRELLNDRRAR